MLGVTTNARSTNWYIRVGTKKNHVIVAGCQVHFVCKSKTVRLGKAESWSQDDNVKPHIQVLPSRIYNTTCKKGKKQ